MMEKFILSVVIPARDAEDTLPACLTALREQTLPPDHYELIVVDDGSRDGTAQVAAEHGAQLIRQDTSGPAAARNAGAQAARGDLLVFTDADCAPAPDFLETISALFDDPDLIGAKGAYRTRQTGWTARFVQGEYEHKYERMARFEQIDFIDTYAAAYRRGVFLENKGFDARFTTASVEDQEFSFRLARKGYRLVFAPQAVVYHRHDRTVLEYLRRKYGIGYWKAYLLRWHPDRLTSDTHTPLAQRMQVVLAPLALILALLSPLHIWAAYAALSALALVGISALPELFSILRRDAALLLIAPVMVLLRALALATGLLIGALRPPRPVAPDQWKPLTLWQRLVKRTLDVITAGVGLILTSPILLIAGLAIRLDSPGPIFFIQKRVGEDGRQFGMPKLRTMVVDAEARLEEVLAQNPLAGPAFKIPDDPRVTRVGRFLRRWSLDELPQLWNIIRGEMSLVGPRPEEVRVVEQYQDWHRKRLAVKPGLTGPMQIAGRGLLDLDERVRMELDYIDRYSLGRDLGILFKTIPAVCSGKGAR